MATTAAPTSASITITLVENGNTFGDAHVFWNASGTFPSGFKVLWSATNSSPVYPGDSNLLISDSGARSAIVHAQEGKSFYFRVCRYVNGGCDTYSNVYTFKLANLISPTPTTGSSITVQKVEATNTSEAKVAWTVSGSFPKGFKVVWSEHTQNPTYPEDTSVFAGVDARTATVTGNPGAKYYIRVCKYNGSGCDFYSSAFSYTFPSPPATTRAGFDHDHQNVG